MNEFAERLGYRAPAIELAEDDIPRALRAGLWDATRLTFFEDIYGDSVYGGPIYSKAFNYLVNQIYFHFYREPTDEKYDDPERCRREIRDRFFAGDFVFVYGFIEFMASMKVNDSPTFIQDGGKEYANFCNRVLKRELSAFQFAGTQLIKISTSEEKGEVEAAITQTDAGGVQKHISTAAALYSQRPSPDYRNSIKESISAVESAVGFVLDEKAYGVSNPLRKISEAYGMHKSLSLGFEKLYAYTSDADGIRHALMDDEDLTQADAKYMLVSCSAFANYLISKKLT